MIGILIVFNFLKVLVSHCRAHSNTIFPCTMSQRLPNSLIIGTVLIITMAQW